MITSIKFPLKLNSIDNHFCQTELIFFELLSFHSLIDTIIDRITFYSQFDQYLSWNLNCHETVGLLNVSD